MSQSISNIVANNIQSFSQPTRPIYRITSELITCCCDYDDDNDIDGCSMKYEYNNAIVQVYPDDEPPSELANHHVSAIGVITKTDLWQQWVGNLKLPNAHFPVCSEPKIGFACYRLITKNGMVPQSALDQMHDPQHPKGIRCTSGFHQATPHLLRWRLFNGQCVQIYEITKLA